MAAGDAVKQDVPAAAVAPVKAQGRGKLSPGGPALPGGADGGNGIHTVYLLLD